MAAQRRARSAWRASLRQQRHSLRHERRQSAAAATPRAVYVAFVVYIAFRAWLRVKHMRRGRRAV